MRWHYRDPLLLWLFPGAYVAHLIEEGLGGFPLWFARVAGQPLPDPAFAAINAAGLIAMVVAVGLAARRDAHGWLAVAIGAVAVLNGALHVAGSLVTASYSPGLFTAVVLWLPLGHLLLLRAWHQAPPPVFWQGALAGFAAHTLVSAAALLSAHLSG
jgi:hypothetical protein